MRPISPRAPRSKARAPQVDALAAEVLAFLADDPERISAFLTSSGLDVGDLRAATGSPAFAEGLLDHLCGDDALLLAFARAHGYEPEAIERFRRSLTCGDD